MPTALYRGKKRCYLSYMMQLALIGTVGLAMMALGGRPVRGERTHLRALFKQGPFKEHATAFTQESLVGAIEQRANLLSSAFLHDVARFQRARFEAPFAFSGEPDAWKHASSGYRNALGSAIAFVTDTLAKERARTPRWLRGVALRSEASPFDGAKLVEKYLRTTWASEHDSASDLLGEERNRWHVFAKMPLAPTPVITGHGISEQELFLGILYGAHPVGLTTSADFDDPVRKSELVGDELFIQNPTHMVVHDLSHMSSLADRHQMPLFRSASVDAKAFTVRIANGIALGDYVMENLASLSPRHLRVAYTFLAKAGQWSNGTAKQLKRALTEAAMIGRDDATSLEEVNAVRSRLDQLLKQYR